MTSNFKFSLVETGMVVDTCNYRTWKLETGESGVQGYILSYIVSLS